MQKTLPCFPPRRFGEQTSRCLTRLCESSGYRPILAIPAPLAPPDAISDAARATVRLMRNEGATTGRIAGVLGIPLAVVNAAVTEDVMGMGR